MMGLRIATSCLIGALFNFAILGPLMIQAGEIAPRMGPRWQTGATLPYRDFESVVFVVVYCDDGGGIDHQCLC